MEIKIIKATYGGLDVTDIVSNHINNGQIGIHVGNALFTDPQPFVEKYFNVKYSIDGNEYDAVFKEGDIFEINKPSEYIPISAKCLTYGRVDTLEEMLYSYLIQDYKGESEFLVINDYPLQKLHFDHPNVRIYNLDFTFQTLGEKDNFAVSACKYDNILVSDDDDWATPNAFNTINKYFKGYELLHWGRGIRMDDGQIVSIGGIGNCGIVYTKQLWKRLHGHPYENAGWDMGLVNGAKKAGARIVYANPTDEELGWCYYWGNRSYHSSGLGAEDGTRPNVIVRHSEHIESLRKQGLIPTGDVELKPKWSKNYSELLKNYICSLK